VVESYGGVWRGNGGRNVPAVSSDVLLTITGKPGLVAGTIAYPNLSCGGVLGFRTVYKDAIELTETITFGADRCPSPGTVTLSLEDSASLKFRWSDPKRTGTASGNLTSMKE
jgi:hypothetical protein